MEFTLKELLRGKLVEGKSAAIGKQVDLIQHTIIRALLDTDNTKTFLWYSSGPQGAYNLAVSNLILPFARTLSLLPFFQSLLYICIVFTALYSRKGPNLEMKIVSVTTFVTLGESFQLLGFKYIVCKMWKFD